MQGVAPSPLSGWPDERLVGACLEGNSDAWAALIDRYKNLIYSMPVRLGLHQDANDIFQSVCLDLLAGLGKLREPKALPKWLMQASYHRCLAAQRRNERHVDLEPEEPPSQDGAPALPEAMLVELQREQGVRRAVESLPPRCQQLIRLLFYEDPPKPYEDVARELNMATGSIGFIRGRCLKRLRKQLQEIGPR